MRFHRAAALTTTAMAMAGSGCWQGDRLLGYVSFGAQTQGLDASVVDAPDDIDDSTNDTEAPSLPCVDSSIYPGGGIYQADIADVSAMSLNGDAASINGALRLARADLQISSGSAYFVTPVSFDAGTSVFAHFAIRIGGGQGEQGADGIAFVLQSSPAGAAALGMSGSSLGYQGVAPSVAVEIDTWHNAPDPPGQHVALLADGDITRHIESASTPYDFNDGVVRYLWVDYDGSLDELEVYVSQENTRPSAPLLTHVGFDFSTTLGQSAYLGFSASTGGSRNDHDVLGEAWFVTTPQPKCRADQ
jgi:hypothetical protein